MRFKQFLNEKQSFLNGFTHSLDTIIQRKIFLWRGADFNHGEHVGTIELNDEDEVRVFKFSARNTNRRSVTGNNILLNMISIWKDFPNRLKSYFATLNRMHAEKFGDAGALIIPADSPNKFGYLPYDVNEAPIGSGGDRVSMVANSIDVYFKTFFHDIRAVFRNDKVSSEDKQILSSFVEQAKATSLVHDSSSTLNGDEFHQCVRLIDVMWKHKNEIKNDPEFLIDTLSKIYKQIEIRGYTSLGEMLADISPKEMNAKLYSLQNIPNDTTGDSEIWFEGEYLALRHEYLTYLNEEELIDILTKLKKQFG